MGLSVEGLHALQKALRLAERRYAPLFYRRRRAGAFKTRDRIDAKIEEVNEEVGALKKRLIDSWGE
jgi:hypothetical protein